MWIKSASLCELSIGTVFLARDVPRMGNSKIGVRMKGSDLRKVVGWLYRLYQYVCRFEVVVCSIFFITIITLVFMSAILRKFNMPIQWSNDVSQLLFAWLAFLGADVALRRGSLVGVGLLTNKMPRKMQKILVTVCYVLMLCFLVIVVRYGFPLAKRNWLRAFQTLPVSYSWVTLSLSVSSILMILSILHNMLVGTSTVNELLGEEE